MSRTGGPGMEWTSVLGTDAGQRVRADYRCTAVAEPTRYGWAQALEDSPFERVLQGRPRWRSSLIPAAAAPR